MAMRSLRHTALTSACSRRWVVTGVHGHALIAAYSSYKRLQ